MKKKPLSGKLAVSIRFIILLFILKLSWKAQTTAIMLWAFNTNTITKAEGMGGPFVFYIFFCAEVQNTGRLSGLHSLL